MARIARLTPWFRRGVRSIGLASSSARRLAVTSTIRAISRAEQLPGASDTKTAFPPGSAYVRRVHGHNLWVLYGFDAEHVDVLAIRDTPPLPADEA